MPTNWDISIQIPAGTQMLFCRKTSGLTPAPAATWSFSSALLSNSPRRELFWLYSSPLAQRKTLVISFHYPSILQLVPLSRPYLLMPTPQLSSFLSSMWYLCNPHYQAALLHRCISSSKQNTHAYHRQSSCNLANPIPSILSKIPPVCHFLVQGGIAQKILGPFHVYPFSQCVLKAWGPLPFLPD